LTILFEKQAEATAHGVQTKGAKTGVQTALLAVSVSKTKSGLG